RVKLPYALRSARAGAPRERNHGSAATAAEWRNQVDAQPKELRELKDRLREVDDFNAAAALLGWDQTTYMPPGGAAARARQLATLAQTAHVKFTDPAVGRLLDALRPYEERLPYDSDDASLIRVTRRDYERLVKVP